MNLCRSKIKTDTFNLSRTLAIFVTTKLQVQIQVFHHLNGIQDTLFPTRKIALWQIKAEGKKKQFQNIIIVRLKLSKSSCTNIKEYKKP